jgi:hypothetical protein
MAVSLSVNLAYSNTLDTLGELYNSLPVFILSFIHELLHVFCRIWNTGQFILLAKYAVSRLWNHLNSFFYWINKALSCYGLIFHRTIYFI